MNFALNIVLALVLTLLASCGGNEDTVILDPQNPETINLVQDIEGLQSLMNEGRIFRSSTPRDRRAIRTNLLKIKISILRLDQNPHDTAALKGLYRSLKFFNKVQFIVNDRSRMSPMFQNVQSKLDEYSRIQGLRLGSLGWPLFSYNFNNGLTPFLGFSTRGNWISDFGQDKSFAKVSSQDVDSWLISPAFDLTVVKEPKFRLKHMMIINQNSSSAEFDRAAILNSVFKAYVSTNYTKGDPNKAKWTEVPLGPFLGGVSFQTIMSPEIDLGEFSSKNVTIALKFNMNTKKLGRHYITWQVENFEILGEGAPLVYEPRKEEKEPGIVVLKNPINAENWEGKKFSQFVMSGNPGEFIYDAGREVLKAKSFNPDPAKRKIGTVLMAYEKFVDLKKVKKPYVQIEQAQNHYQGNARSQKLLKVLIAQKEEGTPLDQLSWVELDFKQTPSGNSWDQVKSEWLAIPETLKDKKVFFAFEYTSTEKDFPSWDIKSLKLSDMEGFDL